ncbi:FAD/NAD(P)-binding domain-containing protein [Aspergillus carlsbadensis]|nr:FAD/NAD(P)-binding domain-containing protein [Aspergillus carlsbadensis]
MKVLIIGAGLGGLTAALAFAQHGHEVVVLERREQLSPQGGSIMIRSGACSTLHQLGLEAALEAMSDRVPTTLVRDMTSGEIIKRYPVEVSETPAWGTTRLDLMHLLYRKVVEAGVDVRFGHFVVDVHDNPGIERPFAELDGGQRIAGDMILVADGIKSRLRDKVISSSPGSYEPIVSDTTFYGFNVAVSDLNQHEGTARLTSQTDVNIWKGKCGYVVTRHNSKTQHVSFLYGVQSPTDQKELWDEDGDIEYVRRIFEGSCTELTIPLQIAQSCDRWRLAEMPRIPRWRTETGRVILLGDSAHAMHPNAGQGYSQIVEDIAVLRFLIHDNDMKGRPLPEITKIWQDIRKPRVERISGFSNWKTQWFSGELAAFTQAGNWGEDARSLKEIAPNMDAPFESAAFLKWVLDFDAPAEARKYLEREGILS